MYVIIFPEADLAEPERQDLDYITLTTHDGQFGSNPIHMDWGNPDPLLRGPVIATVKHGGQRNAIGAHGGGYCVYTALAVAAGELVRFLTYTCFPFITLTFVSNFFTPCALRIRHTSPTTRRQLLVH